MIPGKILRFLEQHANLAFAGTRDRNRVPHGHLVSAWQVDSNGRQLTAFIAGQFTAHLLESLEDNGEVALTVEEYPSHETYQFKGRYRQHREVNEDDLDIVNRIRHRFARSLKALYHNVPEDVLREFVSPASLAVEFEVQEIYLQTPGPGAGTRLIPSTEG